MISIISATQNAAETLPNLISSLRAQSDKNFEWIVIDGASQDETTSILEHASDVVTHWVSEPDFGIYHALNKGLAMTCGTYYLVVGADDVLTPNAIEDYYEATCRSEADVYCASVVIHDAIVKPGQTLGWLRSGPPVAAAHSVGCLIRRSLHAEFGPYSRRFPIAADTFFLLKLLDAGKRFHLLADRVVGIFGTNGASSKDRLGALVESFRVNVETRGNLAIHLAFFVVRVIRNAPEIIAQLRRARLR